MWSIFPSIVPLALCGVCKAGALCTLEKIPPQSSEPQYQYYVRVPYAVLAMIQRVQYVSVCFGIYCAALSSTYPTVPSTGQFSTHWYNPSVTSVLIIIHVPARYSTERSLRDSKRLKVVKSLSFKQCPVLKPAQKPASICKLENHFRHLWLVLSSCHTPIHFPFMVLNTVFAANVKAKRIEKQKRQRKAMPLAFPLCLSEYSS